VGGFSPVSPLLRTPLGEIKTGSQTDGWVKNAATHTVLQTPLANRSAQPSISHLTGLLAESDTAKSASVRVLRFAPPPTGLTRLLLLIAPTCTGQWKLITFELPLVAAGSMRRSGCVVLSCVEFVAATRHTVGGR